MAQQASDALSTLIEFVAQHEAAYIEWVKSPVGARLTELLQPFTRPIPLPSGQRQEHDAVYVSGLGVGRCELFRLVFELLQLKNEKVSLDRMGQLEPTYELTEGPQGLEAK